MNSAADHVQRALDFCDRALDHLTREEPELDEVLPLVEGTRNELLALQSLPRQGGN